MSISALVSTTHSSVIKNSGCFARTSPFFGSHLSQSRVDDPGVGKFIYQILFMLLILCEGWAGKLSLKTNPCVCCCLTAESVQPQMNFFWYPESLAIFWMNLHPVLGFHRWGQTSNVSSDSSLGNTSDWILPQTEPPGKSGTSVSDAEGMWMVWERRESLSVKW